MCTTLLCDRHSIALHVWSDGAAISPMREICLLPIIRGRMEGRPIQNRSRCNTFAVGHFNTNNLTYHNTVYTVPIDKKQLLSSPNPSVFLSAISCSTNTQLCDLKPIMSAQGVSNGLSLCSFHADLSKVFRSPRRSSARPAFSAKASTFVFCN
jgi:hypothetical protein